MLKCIDEKIGAMLHAYELRTLSEEDTELFEIHLLHCDYCCNKVREFEEFATALGGSDKVKAAVERISKEAGETQSARDGILRKLWPGGSLLLKPGFIYILALLLLIPAIYGISLMTSPDYEIGAVQREIYYGVRNNGDAISFSKQSSFYGTIRFLVPDWEEGKKYRIALDDPTGMIVSRADGFDHLDDDGIGEITIPVGDMETGKYLISIFDLSADPNSALVEISFTISD